MRTSLWPSDATLWHRSGSTLARVMACCLITFTVYHFIHNPVWKWQIHVFKLIKIQNFTRISFMVNHAKYHASNLKLTIGSVGNVTIWPKLNLLTAAQSQTGNLTRVLKWSGPRFNVKISSYQYRKSHCGDKTILRPSYLHNGISYTGKTTSLYWIRAQLWPLAITPL